MTKKSATLTLFSRWCVRMWKMCLRTNYHKITIVCLAVKQMWCNCECKRERAHTFHFICSIRKWKLTKWAFVWLEKKKTTNKRKTICYRSTLIWFAERFAMHIWKGKKIAQLARLDHLCAFYSCVYALFSILMLHYLVLLCTSIRGCALKLAYTRKCNNDALRFGCDFLNC